MSSLYRGAGQVKTVAVLGAGVIGSGWIATFLAAGLRVRVFDLGADVPAQVDAWVKSAWPRMQELGLVRPGADPSAVSFHSTLRETLAPADFVQENTPERVAQKAALFSELDALVSADVLVATSTSSLPVTELQAACMHAQRFVLGHPFNPVHLMPLVEVGGGERTAPAAMDTAQAFYESLGKACVRLQREIYGHVANRLSSAMFREAVSLVANGYASVADVDRAIRFGPALKWAVQGQFATFDINGGAGGFRGFLQHFAPGIVNRWASMQTPDLLDAALQEKLAIQVDDGRNGADADALRGRQDRLLLALLHALNAQEKEVSK